MNPQPSLFCFSGIRCFRYSPSNSLLRGPLLPNPTNTRYDMTPLAFMLGKFPGDGSYTHEQAVRGHLSGCGVLTPQQTVPSGALSGGQRSRVAMAAVSFARPHLLILDEPTNNLDLEAVAALADAVESFKGGVVLVSHDQYFVQRVAREVHVVGGGKLTKLDSFDAYKKDIAKGLPEM